MLSLAGAAIVFAGLTDDPVGVLESPSVLIRPGAPLREPADAAAALDAAQ